MDWFRSWHGAPTDIKWMAISAHANVLLYGDVTVKRLSDVTVTPVTVAGIAWALMDSASQNIARGDVGRFDAESYAVWAGIPADVVKVVIQAMEDKNFIKNGQLVNWLKRQGKDNDGSAERTRRWRERQKSGSDVTSQRHGDVTEAKIREDISNTSQALKHPKQANTTVTYDAGFEKLWTKWRPFEMGKGNKLQAYKSYVKAIGFGVELNDIGPAAMAYCDNCERRKVKTQHLVTWLNQRGWETVEVMAKEFDPTDPRNAII